jgi:hypothetical protein
MIGNSSNVDSRRLGSGRESSHQKTKWQREATKHASQMQQLTGNLEVQISSYAARSGPSSDYNQVTDGKRDRRQRYGRSRP